MNKHSSWFGYGIKVGGTLFVAGTETVTGRVFNVGTPSEDHQFSMLSIRAGLGLGAGVGLVGCFIYNCLNLWDLHNKTSQLPPPEAVACRLFALEGAPSSASLLYLRRTIRLAIVLPDVRQV